MVSGMRLVWGFNFLMMYILGFSYKVFICILIQYQFCLWKGVVWDEIDIFFKYDILMVFNLGMEVGNKCFNL